MEGEGAGEEAGCLGVGRMRVFAREEIGQPSILRLTRKAEALAMMSPTLLLSPE